MSNVSSSTPAYIPFLCGPHEVSGRGTTVTSETQIGGRLFMKNLVHAGDQFPQMALVKRWNSFQAKHSVMALKLAPIKPSLDCESKHGFFIFNNTIHVHV